MVTILATSAPRISEVSGLLVGESTRVTMGYSGEFQGSLGLLRPMLMRMGKRALRGDLPTLKQLLESKH